MTTMADSKPINWAYPFKAAGDTSKEVTDPQLYFDALAKAKDGFYPMGANGLRHGGVHFDSNTGALLDQSEIRCIADGEVIAYRIDDKYPETPHAAIIQPSVGPEPAGAKYSTGFVLVKHHLTLPSAPQSAASASDTTTAISPAETALPTASVSERLTFYSLYMHLLDWAGYQTTSAPKPPAFLAPNQYSVKGTSSDPLVGLRVRKLPSGGSTEVLALLPKGCKVTLGETSPSNPNWQQLLSVDEGAAIPSLPSDTIGWVYASELTSNTVADKAKDTQATLTMSYQGLNVRKEGKFTGAIIGVLPRGAILKVAAKEQNGFCKVLQVMDYCGVPELPNGPDGKPLGYVYFDELEAKKTAPSDLGLVHLLPEPYSIKAGDLIGHIGLYQNQGEGTAEPRLHLEVFSCDDVPGFIAKSRALAASLPTEQKTLLKIHKGASKLIPHREDITASNPPKITDEGVTVNVGLTIPISVLERLPAERKIRVSETLPGSTTPRITHWWRLDDLLADEAGNRISGWLAEQELITTRHSPWEWEGFDFLEDTDTPSAGLANYLNAAHGLSDDEKASYQRVIDQSDKGPIRSRLYDIIDTNRDGKMTAEEIKAALEKPWHAQSISHLVTQHESEWFWEASRWNDLDDLMGHSPDDPNQDWLEEKKRIKTLSWWGDVTKSLKLDASGKAWHFQPINLVTMQNLSAAPSSELISVKNMKKIFPSSQEAVREEVRMLFNKYAGLFEVNTPERMSQFFAQVKAEVGDTLVGKEEDLWYSTTALRSLFGRYFSHYPQEANELGYKRISMQQYNALPASAKSGYRIIKNYAYSQLPQEDEIAKRIYCCSVPGQNFQLTPGGCAEGLSYKGKGFIQLTWKENYKSVERLLKAKIPDENIDIVANPNQVLETKYGLLTALGFWEWQNLNAKSGNSTTHTDKITQVVNYHTKSYDKRKENFEFIYGILKNAQ